MPKTIDRKPKAAPKRATTTTAQTAASGNPMTIWDCNDPSHQLLLMTQSEITETQFMAWVGSFYQSTPQEALDMLANGTLSSLNMSGMEMDSRINATGVTCDWYISLIPVGPESNNIQFELIDPLIGSNAPTYYPIGLFRGLLRRNPNAGINLSFDFYNANLLYADGRIRVPGRVIIRLTCTSVAGNSSITYWDLSGSVPPPPTSPVTSPKPKK